MAKQQTKGIHISRKGVFIWLGLIIFIAGWMFVLGILIGRSGAPLKLGEGKHQKEMASLKAKKVEHKQAEAIKKTPGQKTEKQTFNHHNHEALKSPPKKKTPRVPIAKAPQKAKPVPKPKKPKTEKKPEITSKPKTQPQSKPSKTLNTKHKTETNTQTPKGQFTIQIAAVKNANRAQGLVAELRKKGYQAYHTYAEVAGKGKIYRIRVGGYKNKSAANKILAKLKSAKYNGFIISTK